MNTGESLILKREVSEMKRGYRKKLVTAAGFFTAFVLWTAMVCLVDVKPAGPQETTVGLASFNVFVHRLTGVHLSLYELTDLLSLIPLGIMAGFGALGLVQLIRRRSLLKVDRSILLLGGFYAAVAAAFLFFEVFVINYRPVLIDGVLEASYPSSTTMLVLCVMQTAAMQLKKRMKDGTPKKCLLAVMTVFSVFMVAVRLISGVHWFTDIVGGILLSQSLVGAYGAFCES